MYKILLYKAGHKVIGSSYNGYDCIKKLENPNINPDFILMDNKMPLKNGLETVKEILRLRSNQKIIFISADSSIRNKAMSLGVIEFIEKPLDKEILLEKIKQYGH